MVSSLPVRGAWIEILSVMLLSEYLPSLPVRGAWIEIFRRLRGLLLCLLSLPVRGAWIEIKIDTSGYTQELSRSPCGERGLKSRTSTGYVRRDAVAPRAGSVD